jgi:uridine phosphorylase
MGSGAYLRFTAPVAEAALLPGDPALALALARELTEKPLMSNHNRGLWGYYGRTAAGEPLTVQSTGIGGPSSVAVLRELAAAGTRRAVRIGTCRALDPGLEPGDILLVEESVALDGTSAVLGSPRRIVPGRALGEHLGAALGDAAPAVVATLDVLPGAIDGAPAIAAPGGLATARATAVDVATAPLLALADLAGIALAAVLVVAEAAAGGRAADDVLETRAVEAGRAAVRALQRA